MSADANGCELVTTMRDRGLRVTAQRMCIVNHLFENATHPTVEALYEAARVEMPSISLKTVYQTVHDLEGLGEVRLLDLARTGAGRPQRRARAPSPRVQRLRSRVRCRGRFPGLSWRAGTASASRSTGRGDLPR